MSAPKQFLQLGYERGQKVLVQIGDKQLEIPFVKTFADVPLKSSLVYIDSRGRLGLAVNQSSFAATYGIQPPASLVIPAKKK